MSIQDSNGKEKTVPKYMIHTIEKRKWYVDDYICKWLLEQGANKEDITIYVDTNLEGNLEACLKSFDSLRGASVPHP